MRSYDLTFLGLATSHEVLLHCCFCQKTKELNYPPLTHWVQIILWNFLLQPLAAKAIFAGSKGQQINMNFSMKHPMV